DSPCSSTKSNCGSPCLGTNTIGEGPPGFVIIINTFWLSRIRRTEIVRQGHMAEHRRAMPPQFVSRVFILYIYTVHTYSISETALPWLAAPCPTRYDPPPCCIPSVSTLHCGG